MTTAPSRGRKGYTTLEVLVSVAILLVLSGIVVPAVQRVRETANQARCRSNLRQLALAAHGYDAAHGVLPPGYLGPLADSPKPLPAEKTGPWVGCLYLLLPYIEQDGLYSRFEDTRLTLPAGPPPQAGARLRPRLDIQQEAWWVNPANLRPDTGGAHVRLFECPSDDLYAPVDRVFPGYYVGGPFGQYTWLVEPSPNFDTRVLGRTNYAGVAGLQGAALDESFVQGYDGRYDGALSSRSRISLQQIGAHDGTSNTLLFGETLGAARPASWHRRKTQRHAAPPCLGSVWVASQPAGASWTRAAADSLPPWITRGLSIRGLMRAYMVIPSAAATPEEPTSPSPTDRFVSSSSKSRSSMSPLPGAQIISSDHPCPTTRPGAYSSNSPAGGTVIGRTVPPSSIEQADLTPSA